MTKVFPELDDPVRRPASTAEQRQATMRRGDALRRRRQVTLTALPVAVILSVGGALALQSGQDPVSLTPAGPPTPTSVPTEDPYVGFTGTDEPAADAALTVCEDELGDSRGLPDLRAVSLDLPALPFVQFYWPSTPRLQHGTLEAKFLTTSADGKRSRLLVAKVVDGAPADVSYTNLGTGKTVHLDPRQVIGQYESGARQERITYDDKQLSTGYPTQATLPLGEGWTFTASLVVDGVVVDSCVANTP